MACAPAALALGLMVGPGAAVADTPRSAAVACHVAPLPGRALAVGVPATARPLGFPDAAGVCARGAVRVTGTGTISIRTDSPTVFGPAGDSATTAGQGFPLPGVPAYSLIGRIGNGPWRYIGAGPTTLVGRGRLYLAVNDDYYSDNSGAFTAGVARCLPVLPLPGCGVLCTV
ncbi:hypothetical protein AB0C59_18655 [Streptomyces sp. NPDC048664]|uniref:hypothetical protein n=1 Tax=Streptomyces sp. NPDC048664 TaxID=3154505 RepID=UPI003436B112